MRLGDVSGTSSRSPQRVVVEADPTRLAQVFSNSLNNAARYTEGRGNISSAPRCRRGYGRDARLRVLVADDNRDAADSLQRILAIYGHEVRVAYDGNAALRLAEEFNPKVAVLDLGMPGANGFQLACSVRAQRGNGTALIALTGWGQESDRRRAMRPASTSTSPSRWTRMR